MGSGSPNIRCPIHGSIPLSKEEFRLIDSLFFQRLRHISQLGFASFVFPGAVHTRFSHSLGAAHLAGRIFDQLLTDCKALLENHYTKEQILYFRKILRYAALLHDIGHLPFSHASEDILPNISEIYLPSYLNKSGDRKASHEDMSHSMIYYMAEEQKILTHDEAYDIISILSKSLPPSSRMEAKKGNPLIYTLLKQLISGEIDVDRMDYLLRDSYFTGVPYGDFDLDRMISSISCTLEGKIDRFLLTIDGEAVPTYENFLLARVHMFYHIYFHKSLPIYGFYLGRAIEYGEISVNIGDNIESYLNLTENTLQEKFRKSKKEKWSGKLYRRVPARNLIRIMDGDQHKIKKMGKVEALLKQNGIEAMLTYSSNQYSTQIRDGKVNENSVLVRSQEFGKVRIDPLAEKSTLLETKEKLIEIHQLYVHRSDYDKAISYIVDQPDL
ncbi:MAG: HD domain-containing protein [Proteobacteria bacterium]|nr:HD domain-containing protein [Pseudomonadota bacterium]